MFLFEKQWIRRSHTKRPILILVGRHIISNRVAPRLPCLHRQGAAGSTEVSHRHPIENLAGRHSRSPVRPLRKFADRGGRPETIMM